MQSHPLDGDGVNFEIFKYLCKLSRKATPCEITFKIPETIVFANGCASVWYYYDEGTQTVCQRPARDLDRRNLYDILVKKRKTDRCDIVAQFTAWTGDEGHLTTIYYTRADLQTFLFGSSKGYHGLLQKFVEPREDRNDLIEVAWSPQMTFAVRRVNEHRIFDRNLPPATRAATFDGASHVCEETFCNATVRKQMGKATESLVNHFHEVDEEFEIARCVCFFKQDAMDDVWLLYTTSIRIIESTGDSKNTAAYDPEQMSRKPALVPLLLTMQALSESKVAKLRSGGREVVAPPPRRLRGDFFTPAAPVDEAALERASERRRARMDQKHAEQKQEQERLFGVLAKLRREVATLHATLDAGLPIPRAKTASPVDPSDSMTSSPLSRAPQKPSHGSGTVDSSPRTASSPNGRARGAKSPRRRRSQVIGQGSSVSLRSVEVEADAMIRSGRLFVADELKRALFVAGLISDAMYPLAHDVAGSRRPLLHRRVASEANSVGPWSFTLPRTLWRWIARNWAVLSQLGVNLTCHEENRELDDVDVLAGPLADRAALRLRAQKKVNPQSSVTIHVLEPLPTAGAMQRFASRVQTMITADAEFVATQAISAAAFIAKLPGQTLFDELRLVTQGRRASLDAIGFHYVKKTAPADAAAVVPPSTAESSHNESTSVKSSPPSLGAPGGGERKRSVHLTEPLENPVAAPVDNQEQETSRQNAAAVEAEPTPLPSHVDEPSQPAADTAQEAQVTSDKVQDATAGASNLMEPATSPSVNTLQASAVAPGDDERRPVANNVPIEGVAASHEEAKEKTSNVNAEQNEDRSDLIKASEAREATPSSVPPNHGVTEEASDVSPQDGYLGLADVDSRQAPPPPQQQTPPTEDLRQPEQPTRPEPTQKSEVTVKPDAARPVPSREETHSTPHTDHVALTHTTEVENPPADRPPLRPTSAAPSRGAAPARPSSAARKPSAKAPGAQGGHEVEWPSSTSSDSFHIEDDDEPSPSVPAKAEVKTVAPKQTTQATPAAPPATAAPASSSSVPSVPADASPAVKPPAEEDENPSWLDF